MYIRDLWVGHAVVPESIGILESLYDSSFSSVCMLLDPNCFGLQNVFP